ncbi:MAG: winged helix-turn-helix transcriptional regulator [Mycobacterium sp.]|nr:winged helix-turn-helix transcriptional regulator [Mycobacterium sp.]
MRGTRLDNDTESHRRRPNRQHERVLQLVREHDGAVDATELAARMGLHLTTVRFHLDRLCDEGVVARTRLAPTGVGRPRTGYVAVRDRLDYQSLAEILALELGDNTEQRRRRAERAGRRWAERIAAGPTPETLAAQPSDSLNHQAATTAEVFRRMGFGPELGPPSEPAGANRQRTIRLHACPVRDLARAHPEVGCAMHLGLLEGLLAHDPVRRAGSPALHAQLEPFVEPDLCIAKVIASD